MGIFSKEISNPGRQAEIDFLRGFTAIILVIVHVGLYLGNNIGKGLWTFCDIIGSEFAAPIFMALMGISMAYSRHQQPKELFKRGLNLFIFGYAISFFRSLLPLLIFGNIDEWASVEAFFVVDILQFAGLSFLFFALFKKLRLPNIVIFLISIVMVIVDQFIMLPDTVMWSSKLLTGLVNLFCPVSEWSCFPFLTWFCFPTFGLCFGQLLIHCSQKKKMYCILLPVGLLGVLYVYYQFHLLYPDYTSYYFGHNFYYMGLKNVLLTMLFVCFALAFWFFAEKILPDIAKRFLVFLSKNLNTYYIFSWIIISALIHIEVIAEWKLNTPATIGIMIPIIVLCAVLAQLWLMVKKKFSGRRTKLSISSTD